MSSRKNRPPPLQQQPDNALRQLLISIHDVMPSTLERCRNIVARLNGYGYRKTTLLVVPGTGWDGDTISELRALVADGAELAGHGWVHKVERIRGWRHRLHSALISRDVAEHLALDVAGRVELMRRCYDWFGEHALPAPTLYVPPAWAMGPMPRESLKELPYRQHETLTGIYDTGTGSFRLVPMVGFEADTALRATACRLWNGLNLLAAGRTRPVRVAVHPDDFELELADDLAKLFETGGTALSYNDLAIG